MSGHRVTRNITLEELVRSRDHAELAASPYELAAALVITLVRLALVLQAFRDRLDAGAIYVTSGYRPRELHEAIHAPRPAPSSSRHLLGTAADFELEELESIAAFVRIAKLGLKAPERLPGFDRLCLYPKRGHLHLEVTRDPRKAPRHLLYIDSGGGWRPISYEAATELLEAA